LVSVANFTSSQKDGSTACHDRQKKLRRAQVFAGCVLDAASVIARTTSCDFKIEIGFQNETAGKNPTGPTLK